MKKVNAVFFVRGYEVEDIEIKYYNKKREALNTFQNDTEAILVSIKDIIVGRRKSKYQR